MKKRERTVLKHILKIWTCLVLGACTFLSCLAQEKRVSQSATVGNMRMGAYRALVELSFQTFQREDNSMAAELARILERTWDQGSGKLQAMVPIAK
jgi:hypothetical protein